MDIKTVRLAGRDFPIPPLALDQIKVIVPLILKLKTMDMNAITAQNMDDLAEICYVAAAKGTPGLTRADFNELHVTADEMLNAHPTIALQAGMVFAQSGGGVSGEMPAG